MDVSLERVRCHRVDLSVSDTRDLPLTPSVN